jgi:hypothetical protein
VRVNGRSEEEAPEATTKDAVRAEAKAVTSEVA